VACFWGATALTAIAQTVLANTGQTTAWALEFTITGSSTTAAWLTGYLQSSINSATIPVQLDATPSSDTGLTAGAQTLDLRFSMSVTVATDSWNIQSITMERLQ
jgi:hypothetical protein